MTGRDSAPCSPSMQAPKLACRRPNQHTGGQGWPWISNSPTCVLGLQLFTAMFILCNARIRTRASCVLGMLDSQSTTVHIFKTKKIKNHTQVLTMCWSSKMCSSVSFGHCLLCVPTPSLSTAPAASLCLPVHCFPAPVHVMLTWHQIWAWKADSSSARALPQLMSM